MLLYILCVTLYLIPDQTAAYYNSKVQVRLEKCEWVGKRLWVCVCVQLGVRQSQTNPHIPLSYNNNNVE